jgi:hypothetical protein
MKKFLRTAVDLGKNYFQFHGLEGEAGSMISRKLKRSKVLEFYSQIERCRVGMEACGSNSRHTSVIGSPSSTRATKRRRSSITELAFHGINTSHPKAKSVTHVSGTKCHLCLGPLSPVRYFWSASINGHLDTGPTGPFSAITGRSLCAFIRSARRLR